MEAVVQDKQKRQNKVDYMKKVLRTRDTQLKALYCLVENFHATWNIFATRIMQKDSFSQVTSAFLNNENKLKSKWQRMDKWWRILDQN